MRNFRNLIIALPAATALLAAPLLANDKEDHDYDHDDKAAMFIHGAPSHPTDAWTLAAGGRIYDNWAEALDRELPETTHPGYPAAGKQTGAGTWRCKECHGWDYQGADGVYSKGSHYSGIKGISGAIGMDEAAIAAAMRAAPHGYTSDMINDDELARLAAFVSRGQVDMSKYVDLATRAVIPGRYRQRPRHLPDRLRRLSRL